MQEMKLPHVHLAKRLSRAPCNRARWSADRSRLRSLNPGHKPRPRLPRRGQRSPIQSHPSQVSRPGAARPTSITQHHRFRYLFKTSKARAEEAGRNHLLRHVARATSAAPTYFEAFLLDDAQWKGEQGHRRALVDGGVFANNPSMIGLSEALSSGTDMSEILLCAVGTGMNDRKIPYDEAKDWGPLGWAKPVISVMMDGMSDSADYHARKLLSDSGGDSGAQRYFRFDIRLENALDDLDAVHRANVIALSHEADKIMIDQKDELDRLVDLLRVRADD